MSWGGTMFEYLMPQLLMRNFPGTLLDQSCRASVRRQIDYGRQRERAVGHLGVGLRVHRSRGQLSVPRVRRARARAQARPGHRPGRSRRTPRRWPAWSRRRRRPRTSSGWPRLGLEGRYGFYESLDYNPRSRERRRARRTRPCARPSSAPTSRTTRACRSWRSPTSSARTCSSRGSTPIRASRPPSCCSRSACRARPSCRSRGRPRPPPRRRRCRCSRRAGSCRRTRRASTRTSSRTGATPRRSPTPAAASACGATSRSRAGATTRRPTPARQFIYLRDPWSGRVWSATYQPVCQEPDRFEATFDLDKITFRRRDADIETQLEITVSSEDDVEVRRLTITNRGSADPRDRGHQLRRDRAGAARRTTSRTRRSASCSSRPSSIRRAPACCSAAGRARPTNRRSSAFHVLGVDGPRLGGAVEWETDRARFLGRGRSPANPIVARRPGAVGHDRRRARSDRRAARAHPAGARRRRPRDVRHRRRAGSRRRAGAGAQVSRRQRGGARLLDGVHPRPHHAAAPRAQRRARDPLRSAGLARLRLRHVAASARRIWRPTRSASRTCGATASPATCRSCCVRVADAGVAAARAPAAERAGVLARQGAARRPRHPERAAGRLPRRDAAPADAAGAGAAVGRLARKARRHVPAPRRRACPTPTAICWLPWRGSCCRATSAISSSQLERPAPWLLRRATTCRGRRSCARRSRAPMPVPVPPLVMENGLGGFTPDGREYVVVLDGERETPLPWSNVLANPGVRHDRQQRRVGVHLGRQQPREPADAVRQRSADRSDRRGDLPARRGHRRGVGRHAGAAAAARRWRALGHPPRAPASRAISTPSPASTQELAVFVAAGRSGEAGAADADQHRRAAAADQRVRLRRMVPRAAAQRRAALRRHRHGSRDRRDRSRRTPTTREHAGARRVLRAPASRRRHTPATAPSSSAATARSARRRRSSASGSPGAPAPASTRARRCRWSSSSSPASRAASRSCSARDATARTRASWPARYGALAAGGGDARRDRADVGRLPRRRSGAHARRLVRPHRQSLAAVPDAELPHLGAQRPVSARRRVRLPRSAAGRAGAAVRAAGSVPRAPAAGRLAAVRRGRRAALVASAERPRNANALLRRSAVAARTASPATSTQTGDESVLDEVVPFLEAPLLEPDQAEAYLLPHVSSEIGVAVRALRCARSRTR